MRQRNLHKKGRGGSGKREGEKGRENVVKRAEKRAEKLSAARTIIATNPNSKLTRIYLINSCTYHNCKGAKETVDK